MAPQEPGGGRSSWRSRGKADMARTVASYALSFVALLFMWALVLAPLWR
jgi:hypothetical protein